MPEYLDDPTVLTKEKLKNELLANNVELPSANSPKDVYVQLYLKNLTAQNTRNVSTLDGFSSDEDLPPPVVHSRSRSSGRKAIRKTDKVQSEALDVAELTAEGLKDELMKYGVEAGPIVASTRRVYEKKLQRLLEDSISPATTDLPPVQTETETNHNGHADLDQFSDKEEEEIQVIPEPEPEVIQVIPEPEPLPEPIPLVERLVRSGGKTPVTARTRSSQHHKVGPNNVCSVLGHEPEPRPLVSQAQTDPAPSPSRNAQLRPLIKGFELTPPASPKTRSHAPPPIVSVGVEEAGPGPPVVVEKVVAVDQTPRAEERDVLKEVFANDINSPSGIIASCRKPIRGAAGRPIQPSDFWKDENLMLSPKSLSTTTTTTSTFSETRHRSSNVALSTPSSSIPSAAPRLVSAAPPAAQAATPRPGLSVWLKLFLLVLLVSFLFFVYQTMEAEVLSPFSRSETAPSGSEGAA